MKYHHLGRHFEEFQLKISKFRIQNSFSEITLINDVKKCFTTYGIVMYERDDKGSLVTSGGKRENLSLTDAETKNFSCFYHKVCILRIFVPRQISSR